MTGNLANLRIGPYQLLVNWSYVGDAYGMIKSRGWGLSFFFVRNP